MSQRREGGQGGTFHISVVAQRFGIHPQTLRMYEREGLLRPSRSRGNTRLYSEEDLQRLQIILHLTRDLGVNLAGVEVVIHLRARLEEVQRQFRTLLDVLQEEMDRRLGESSGADLIPASQRRLVQLLRRMPPED